MLICMRTTVDIDDYLYQAAKVKAATEGKTLTAVIEEALRELIQKKEPTAPYLFKWKTFKGRVMPGVNLDDRSSLYDLMEDRK